MINLNPNPADIAPKIIVAIIVTLSGVIKL